jgi:dTDP-glucose 4,6-dehydratase
MPAELSPSAHLPRQVLVTGGAGFIGSNFVRHLLVSDPGVRVVTLDALTYAGRLANLASAMTDPRHTFVEGDICEAALVRRVMGEHAIDTVVHFAAESHVDRSITGPAPFITTNVVGTFILLEAARDAWAEGRRTGVRFHHVSTDEVFGSLGDMDPLTHPTPPARQARITSRGRTIIRTACRSRARTARTISGPISIRRNSFPP